MSERLKFSSQILRLLGEELNPSPDQGIIELVKNAYDADSSRCMVELISAHLPNGSIRVTDDGDGMMASQIRDGWLTIGESRKNPRNRSPSGRLLVGSKGLGRLAALRLGRRATLISRPRSEPAIEYQLVLDWDRFGAATLVEDVELTVEQKRRAGQVSPGVEILIEQIGEAWTQGSVQRLGRALVLLADPFGQPLGFRPKLVAKGFEKALSKVEKSFLTESDYHVVSELDASGKAKAKVYGPSGGLVFDGSHEDILEDADRPVYACPPVGFELWEFLLDSRRFTTKNVTLRETKGWLQQFGGVHVYYRGVRVSPYGDDGNDWLEMNLRRAQRQELRPSTNNSIGRIRIEDPDALLGQKTDRLGFLDNNTFRELQRFANDVLEWVAAEKHAAREKRKKAERARIEQEKSEAEVNLKVALDNLPPDQRAPLVKAVAAQKSAQQQEIENLIDEKQLYQTLGTVGTTASAFAHQSRKPLQIISNDVDTLEDLLANPESASFPAVSAAIATRIKMAADALLAFSSVTLKLLQHEKRRKGRQPLQQRIKEVVELLQPYFEFRRAEAKFEFQTESEVYFYGSRAMFESIITNLINNSLQAFARDGRGDDEPSNHPRSKITRELLFRVDLEDADIRVTVMDNGPGIVGIGIDDIWIPGKTTTAEGTGLGLTIVRDAVHDLNGTISAKAHGELGGAQFTIVIPQSK